VQALEAKDPGNIHAIRHLVSGENYRKSFQETGDAQSRCVANCLVLSNGLITQGLLDEQNASSSLLNGLFNGNRTILFSGSLLRKDLTVTILYTILFNGLFDNIWTILSTELPVTSC
jgi:hypothetical protein